MRRSFCRLAGAVLAFGAIVSLAPAAGAQSVADTRPQAARHETLIIGRVSESPRKMLPAFERMGDMLVGRLGDRGIKAADVHIARSIPGLADELTAGRIDVVFDTLQCAALLQAHAGAEIVLREWKNGTPEYRSLIVVAHDSPHVSLTDLVGGRIAFEDASSTSGFRVPASAILAAGLRLRPMATPQDSPSADTVAYYFANQEINVAAQVARGIASAGALSDVDWADPERVPAKIRETLRVIYASPPIVRSVVLVRGDLPSEIKLRIVSTLVDLHRTEEGRAFMRGFFGVTRYDRIEGEAAEMLRTSIEILGRAPRS